MRFIYLTQSKDTKKDYLYINLLYIKRFFIFKKAISKILITNIFFFDLP